LLEKEFERLQDSSELSKDAALVVTTRKFTALPRWTSGPLVLPIERRTYESAHNCGEEEEEEEEEEASTTSSDYQETDEEGEEQPSNNGEWISEPNWEDINAAIDDVIVGGMEFGLEVIDATIDVAIAGGMKLFGFGFNASWGLEPAADDNHLRPNKQNRHPRRNSGRNPSPSLDAASGTWLAERPSPNTSCGVPSNGAQRSRRRRCHLH
jgi:hypothetical protein